jgi:transcriptional regulator with XRE-family HTH domain
MQFEAKEIGRRIALARTEAGLTQEEVADLATFSKRSLQDYEAGVTIPYRNMREISRLLGRPVEWFLHGDPEPSTDPPADQLERRLEALEARVADGFQSVQGTLEQLADDVGALSRRLPPEDDQHATEPQQ